MLQVELDLPSSQIMGLFNRAIRKFVKFFTSLQEEEVGKGIPLLPSSTANKEMEPLEETLDEELTKAAKEFSKTSNNTEIEKIDLSQ